MNLEHHLIPREFGRLHVVSRNVSSDSATVLMLLHGWPQTWWEWRTLLELLPSDYFVICPDLRGCGDSDKPTVGYDALSLAADQFAILDYFGVEKVAVAGHDLGGPVAYAMAATRPDRVSHLAMVEAPLFGIGDTGASPETQYWHMLFHQASDIPELLVSGREEAYLSWFYRTFAFQKDAIGEEDLRRYAKSYSAPGGLRGGFAHYRAIPQSKDQIVELSKTRLTQPVLALGGEACLGPLVKVLADQVAVNVTGGIVEKCGHWIPEERPDYLAEQLVKLIDLS